MKITEELKWEDLIKPSERLARIDENTSKKEEPKPPEQSIENESSKTNEDEPEQTTNSEESKSSANDEQEESQENTKTDSDETMETEPEPIPTHLFRVGWSLPNTCLQLGEHKYSYGYESTGRFVTEKQFSDYGSSFGVGDVIGSYIEITSENVTMSYAVNGTAQGTAIVVSRSDFPEGEDFALFPHILSRNYAFELNLGSREEAWYPNSDYVFVDKAEEKVQGPLRPETRSECEVGMFRIYFNFKLNFVVLF